jgi:hypothetical protein
VAVLKKTIAVPKRKKIVPKPPKFKVPKRVATVSSSKRTSPLTLDTLKIKIRREKKSYSRKKAKNGVFSKQKITGAYIKFLFFLALTL